MSLGDQIGRSASASVVGPLEDLTRQQRDAFVGESEQHRRLREGILKRLDGANANVDAAKAELNQLEQSLQGLVKQDAAVTRQVIELQKETAQMRSELQEKLIERAAGNEGVVRELEVSDGLSGVFHWTGIALVLLSLLALALFMRLSGDVFGDRSGPVVLRDAGAMMMGRVRGGQPT